MAEHIVDLIQNKTRLAHITFKRTLFQIEQKSCLDLFFVAADHMLQPFQCGDAKRDIQCRSSLKESTLAVDDFFHFCVFHNESLLYDNNSQILAVRGCLRIALLQSNFRCPWHQVL